MAATTKTRAKPNQPEPEQTDRLLTPAEVCERLGVNKRWIRRAIDEGRIERVKIGSLNRFRESHINDLVEKGTG